MGRAPLPSCAWCGGRRWVSFAGWPVVCACVSKGEQATRKALDEAKRKANPRRFSGQAITGFGTLGQR